MALAPLFCCCPAAEAADTASASAQTIRQALRRIHYSFRFHCIKEGLIARRFYSISAVLSSRRICSYCRRLRLKANMTAMQQKTAAIVVIGNEILTGKSEDRNAA